MMMAHHEFLPLCDVLFNIISLAAYFCDVVFDVVFGYALYVHSQYEWFVVIIWLVVISSVTQQIMSARWYLHFLKSRSPKVEGTEEKPMSVIKTISSTFVLFLHAIQMGVLWRYFKLFVPVDLRIVKYEVRDLCMLRLVHAFCESMPLLLIQLHLYTKGFSKQFRDLNTVSILLSLFNVCWALASFNKNVRKHNVHRLVLTWLGVIFQFFWRLGTIGARAISLVAYAHLFEFWIFLVILLHWFSMFLWILSPKNVFHGERLPCSRKVLFCSVIAFVYTFAYINLIDVNHREKMFMFYIVMGLENAMLMFVWIVGVSTNEPPSYRFTLPLSVSLMFMAGLGFMWLYYRYFHVRRLKYEAGGRFSYNSNNNNNKNVITDNNAFTNVIDVTNANCKTADFTYGDKEIIRRHSFSGGYTNLNDLLSYSRMKNESSMSSEENKIFQKVKNFGQSTGNDGNPLGGIPGVFNCRFSNPYVAAMQKRKRKKPTSFVPPPSITQTGHSHNDVESVVIQRNDCAPNNGYNSVPFWYRPLPNQNHQSCSENEGSSVGSRPDIQQKLLEKRRKQLAELEEIEEEIKLGKLHRKPDSKQMVKLSPRPPHDKKPPHYGAPEILLTPRFLPTNREEEDHYYEWSAQANNASMYRLLNEESLTLMQKTYLMSSDLDSQFSLPRSYTLPREFKYYRKTRPRKSIRVEHFVPSTNSSDGDVDSGDESDSGSSHMTSQPQSLKLPSNTTLRVRHETRL